MSICAVCRLEDDAAVGGHLRLKASGLTSRELSHARIVRVAAKGMLAPNSHCCKRTYSM